MHLRERGGRKKIHHEIAIRHRVHAVGGDRLEPQQPRDHPAIEAQRRSRQCSRAERHDSGARRGLLEAFAVSAKHLDIGKQVMRERDGLRALQVRVAGHDRRDVAPREPSQASARSPAISAITPAISSRKIKPHVERDLIVARTAGVELAPRLADQCDQPSFDRQVNIFVGDIEFEASIRDFTFDPLESGDDRAQLARLE